MAYDLEEQESLAEIKAWWEKWGNLILTVVTVACLCAAGFQGWRWYQRTEAADAGTVYAQMIQASNANDENRVMALANRLHDSYASTVYAGMGALLAARTAEAAGKNDEAVKALEWIVGSDKYPELEPVAAVRLAGVKLDEGKYDEALKALDTVKDPKGQEVIINDRRGDIYLAKGDLANAKKSYEDALKKAPLSNPLVGVLQVKLNSLSQPKE